MARVTEHRVVEISPVTDDELTATMNELAVQGWTLDHADYIKEAGIRRPQMAYLYFSRTNEDD